METHSSTLALKIPWMEELGAGYYPWDRKESSMTERLHFLSFFLSFLLRKASFHELGGAQAHLVGCEGAWALTDPMPHFALWLCVSPGLVVREES